MVAVVVAVDACWDCSSSLDDASAVEVAEAGGVDVWLYASVDYAEYSRCELFRDVYVSDDSGVSGFDLAGVYGASYCGTFWNGRVGLAVVGMCGWCGRLVGCLGLVGGRSWSPAVMWRMAMLVVVPWSGLFVWARCERWVCFTSLWSRCWVC